VKSDTGWRSTPIEIDDTGEIEKPSWVLNATTLQDDAVLRQKCHGWQF
jgi:hypothetical protein